MAKKKRYRFVDRNRYGRGIISTVTSAVSIVIFLSAVFICMVMAGNAPQWIGALGFSGFVMGFYGMVAGLESFRERNEADSAMDRGRRLRISQWIRGRSLQIPQWIVEGACGFRNGSVEGVCRFRNESGGRSSLIPYDTDLG